MAKEKTKEIPRTLSAHVSETTYFKFRDISAKYGERVSDTLRRLIDDFIKEFDEKIERLVIETISDEITETNPVRDLPPATEKQINYLGLLCRRTGEDFHGKLNIEEANLKIQELLKKIEDSNDDD